MFTSATASRAHQGVGGDVELGVRQDDHVGLGPAERLHALAVLRAGFVDALRDRAGADEADRFDIQVCAQGITAALSVLRDVKKRSDFIAVGYELFDVARDVLIDGTLKMAISQPQDRREGEGTG